MSSPTSRVGFSKERHDLTTLTEAQLLHPLSPSLQISDPQTMATDSSSFASSINGDSYLSEEYLAQDGGSGDHLLDYHPPEDFLMDAFALEARPSKTYPLDGTEYETEIEIGLVRLTPSFHYQPTSV
jgi:hypothetical protein